MIIFPRKKHTSKNKRSNCHAIVLVKQTSKEEQDHKKGNLMLECNAKDTRQPDFFPWYRGVDAPP